MSTPLMPKATAVWLIENTTLTFEQIANFCHLHVLEVQGIADGEVAKGIIGVDPITAGQLNKEEVIRCQNDPRAHLKLSDVAEKYNLAEQKSKKAAKYTPVAKRQYKYDAIMWLLSNCHLVSNQQIAKLIGTTKQTIDSIRNKTHWNAANIKPRDPVLLGLCSQYDLEQLITACNKKLEASKAKQQADISAALDAVTSN